jgi:hypothetical protein
LNLGLGLMIVYILPPMAYVIVFFVFNKWFEVRGDCLNIVESGVKHHKSI